MLIYVGNPRSNQPAQGMGDWLSSIGNIVAGAGNIASAIGGHSSSAQPAPAFAPAAPAPTTQAQAFNPGEWFAGTAALVLASRAQPQTAAPTPAAGFSLSSITPQTAAIVAGGIVLVALFASSK